MRRVKLLELAEATFPEIERKELYASILCGELYLNGERLRDPKAVVPADSTVELRRRRFVSRGGEKLAAAIEAWSLPVAGSVWLDAGSSTGGFTDALLQAGAAHVHAVDVGTNQLAYTLRRDSRVSPLEGISLFEITSLEPPADYACCDLSFRSLAGAASHLLTLTRERRLIALLKPQFELARRIRDEERLRGVHEHALGQEQFDGVVRDEGVLRQVLLETLRLLEERDRAGVVALMESPIRGGEGNREFLADLRFLGDKQSRLTPETVVEQVLPSD
ncbi:MAG: TlyA family RNA methyltransferase [Spirochaetaceae bacterium]